MQYSEKEYLDARHGVDPGLREGEDLTSYNNEIITNHNQELIESYPWLSDNIVWNEDETFSINYEKEDFTWTWLDAMEDGWRLAFGLNLCYDLKQELKKYNYNNKYYISEIKEKYGVLCWYDGGYPSDSEVENIIDKYEELSKHFCMDCGNPTEWTLDDSYWIYYYCDDCKKKLEADNPSIKFVRMNEKDQDV